MIIYTQPPNLVEQVEDIYYMVKMVQNFCLVLGALEA